MSDASRPGRLHAVDTARGVAVIGMIVFHGAWDLHAYGLSGINPGVIPAWRLFGHAIACCFLFLSGFSLVLAHRRGSSLRSAIQRLLMVAAAAVTVTVATWVAVPDRVILFGILHCIVIGNGIALLVLDAPVLVILGLAGLAALLPIVLAAALPDGLWFVGLSAEEPQTFDMRPILPWIAPILLGVTVGRSHEWERSRFLSGWLAFRPIEVVGRHSLTIYLLHQPLLLTIIAAVTGSVLPPRDGFDPTEPATAAFLKQCEASCHAASTDLAICRSACRCALTAALYAPRLKPSQLATSCMGRASTTSGR